MSKDSRLAVSAILTWPWNPFQDLVSNRVVDEPAHISGTGNLIIVPRNGPFFTRNFKIKLKATGRELSMAAGEYSFVHPFGSFIENYSRLVYGAVLVKGVSSPTDYVIEYDTIGGNFVLDDIAYAEAVANTLTAARTIDWSELVNLPDVWPPDPHPHPASDTMNYGDLIVWMQSYLDAITDTNSSVTWKQQFEAHLEADLQNAHKAQPSDIGFDNLKDWPMCTEEDLQGQSTEVLMNVWGVKELIRSFSRGEWR
ncbi:putative tail fiber protein [Edwardsiella phage pEt-SU]|uniref:Putative tail fiber protein n=1 Tax=Edwardsiella phage pEt-SU TaxID=2562142 RepID=A0A4D6DWI7_9CAUD|nr:virion structural protein [Edwardsiella phage pEt-SU]QBZ70662.1 putative tail fiber protein [Edwardsiella phage pEt-SU]